MSTKRTLFSPENKNFLAPVGFRFIMDRTPNTVYFCQSVNLPEISIGVREIQTPVKEYQVPGDKMTFGELSLTFLINENLDNFYEIYDWMKGLTNPKDFDQFPKYIASVDDDGRTLDDFTKLTTDARLLILDSNYNTTSTVVFFNLFPISLSGVRFTSDANDIDYVTADVTFRYTLFEFIDEEGNRL